MASTSLFFLLAFLVAGLSAECPSGTFYSAYDDMCYLAHSPVDTWYSSINYCRSIGGDLFVPSNSFENLMFSSMLQDYKLNSSWLGVFSESIDFWSNEDGEIVEYTRWAKGEPSMNNSCVVMTANGDWLANGCGVGHSFMCRLPPTIPPPTTSSSPSASPNVYYGNPKCPGYNWTNTDSVPCPRAGERFYLPTCSCYFMARQNTNYSWYSAEEYCVKQGGHLASIHSQDEAVFVKGIFLSMHQFIHVGLQYIGGEWIWSDGTPVDFVNWSKKSVNTNQAANPCAFMNSDGSYSSTYLGNWPCTSISSYAVCKRRLV